MAWIGKRVFQYFKGKVVRPWLRHKTHSCPMAGVTWWPWRLLAATSDPTLIDLTGWHCAVQFSSTSGSSYVPSILPAHLTRRAPVPLISLLRPGVVGGGDHATQYSVPGTPSDQELRGSEDLTLLHKIFSPLDFFARLQTESNVFRK
jgi:hypothetical protein